MLLFTESYIWSGILLPKYELNNYLYAKSLSVLFYLNSDISHMEYKYQILYQEYYINKLTRFILK